MIHRPFHGAKLFLTHGSDLLTYLRDDFAHIPFPGCWDLPGGGREGQETPLECALRELAEEFSLHLPAERLIGHEFPSVQRPDMASWLFMGNLTGQDISSIRFGDEGQEWRMMSVDEYLAHPTGIPPFQRWIRRVRQPIAEERT